MADTLNAETRAAYARWLALRTAGQPSAEAYAEYEAVRRAEAEAYIASRKA